MEYCRYVIDNPEPKHFWIFQLNARLHTYQSGDLKIWRIEIWFEGTRENIVYLVT